jgi:aryl-alcohol dehydrogenase-like predicted oxidoreductase
MNRPTEAPLVLGGHSFISQLGNDPPPSAQEQRAIVQSCLDHGIRWFDTTYQPERIALGNALHALARRDEARILAWNFFTDFGPGGQLGQPDSYRPGHIDVILAQLRTAYVDCLVMVPLANRDENQRQVELMIEWQRKGYARTLGLWVDAPAIIEHYRHENPFRFAIRSFSVTTDDAAAFANCKRCGWETLATSPFVRGWELDRIIVEASARGYGKPEALRPVLADLMLRFSLYQASVDRVIVAMRKLEWVTRNLESVSKGPLTAEEHRWLLRLRKLAARRERWQRRVRKLMAGKTRLWQRIYRTPPAPGE